MAHPPAKCRQCGNVFECTGFDFGDSSSGFTLKNMGVSCPLCGGDAFIGDGTYDSVGDRLKLVSGPAETKEMLERLYGVAQRAKEEDLTAREILAEVAEVNPELAKKLEKKRLPTFILILLIFLFVRHFEVKAEISLDINHLIDQAYHLSHFEDPEQHLDEVVSKAPDAKPKPTEVEKQSTIESRQARRHRERQARRRAPPPSR